MLSLFRPFFFARRVRQTILAVPGVREVRVYPEVIFRRVVEVVGDSRVPDWEYQLATAVYDTMNTLGGYVSHELDIYTPPTKED